MTSKLKKVLQILLIISLFVCSFSAGVMVTRMGWLTEERVVEAAPKQQGLGILLEVWDLVNDNFIDQAVFDNPDELTYAAAKGLTEALGDTGHTRFLTPTEAQQHAESMSGRFFGIGAYLGLNENEQPIVLSPIKNSPAEAAGLRSGDLLLAVDGADVTTWTVEEVVDAVKGDKGTPVTLLIQHLAEPTTQEIVIIRDEVIVPVISWAFIPNSKDAFIRLEQFSASATEELQVALLEVQEHGATGIILDIRNNTGGWLNQAVSVASQFLGEGDVLIEEDNRGNRHNFGVRPGGVALDIPLVVLINEVSASSSEIFAGAIQDYQRGVIVGETSFGTGTVLTPYTLSDGSVLLLGTGQWLTPQGRVIRRQGITPDVVVELPPGNFMLYPDDMVELTRLELFHAGDTQLIEGIKRLHNCWLRWGCDVQLNLNKRNGNGDKD